MTAYVIKATATGFIFDDASFAISVLGSMAVGVVLLTKRPENRVGWIVAGLAWSMAVQEFLEAYSDLAVLSGWNFVAVAWLDGKSFLLLWAGVIALFLYFPTGELPSPRWRTPARVAAASIAFGFVSLALNPGPLLEEPLAGANPMNPTGLPQHVWDRVAFIDGIGLTLLLASMLMAMAALVVRFRRSHGVERVQIRWVVTAAVGFGVVTILSVGVRQVFPQWLDVADFVAGLAFIALPLSVAVAILRFRLYDIDRVINRTVVYAILTAVLAVAYLAVVTVIRSLTARWTGDTAIAVAGSTLVVAALFRPARQRIQSAVDRRFNRARYDAVATVEAFSTRLRDEVDLDTLHAELVNVVRTTMQPARAALWLREVSL